MNLAFKGLLRKELFLHKWRIKKPTILETFLSTFETFFRGAVKKKTSIFVDIIQIGGREVNTMSKN